MGLDLVSIIVLQHFVEFFHTVKELGPVYIFRIWTSAKPQPMINVLCQSLWLEIVNIIVHANVFKISCTVQD